MVEDVIVIDSILGKIDDKKDSFKRE